MDTATTARTWTLFDAFCWCVGWLIFWRGIFGAMRAREMHIDAYEDALPPWEDDSADAYEPDSDHGEGENGGEGDEETEPVPAATFTDEVMAAIREKTDAQLRAVTARPASVGTADAPRSGPDEAVYVRRAKPVHAELTRDGRNQPFA